MNAAPGDESPEARRSYGELRLIADFLVSRIRSTS
jgi:hypothetical protein